MNSTRAALLQGAVDRQSGELFTMQPMTAADVNARRLAADNSRPAQDFTGVWVEPHVEMMRRPRTRPEGARHEISAGRPQVKFTATALPYAPALRDRITRQQTGERFEVAEIGGDGYGRTILSLTARGS